MLAVTHMWAVLLSIPYCRRSWIWSVVLCPPTVSVTALYNKCMAVTWFLIFFYNEILHVLHSFLPRQKNAD